LYIALAVAVVVICGVAGTAAVFVVNAVRRPDGHTTVLLRVDLPGGVTPDRSKLSQTASLLVRRAKAAKLYDPKAVVRGDRSIEFTVGGQYTAEALGTLTAPADLRFRKVLDQLADSSANPEPAAPTPAATANTGDSSITNREAVVAKLGPAYPLAQAIAAAKVTDPAQREPFLDSLAPFRALSAGEVALLPAEIQFYTPTVSCQQLNQRPTAALHDALAPATACGRQPTGATKYLLDVAKVSGDDIARAKAANQPQMGGWMITLSFKSGASQARWTDLTTEVYDNGAAHQVAIVIDNAVVSAPSVRAVITGDAVVTGDFSANEARMLAAALDAGPLPLTLTIVSATYTT
jgi:preprotein translocase subunit SecD